MQDERQLVGVAAHHLLEAAVRQPRVRVLAVRRQQRARQVGVPAHALDLVRAARIRGQGRVDGGLVEGGAVEAGDAADGHGGVAQVVVKGGEFALEGREGGGRGDPGVFATAFEAVEALDVVRGVVEGVVGVREEQLRGVVVGDAEGAFGVFAVGGDVEGLVGAADGMDEDAAEEALQDEGVEVVFVGSLFFEVRGGEVDDFHNSGRGGIEQLVQHFENDIFGA